MEMENNTCKEIEPLLDGYFDGEISSTEMQLTKEHLFQCALCQAKLVEIESISQALSALPKLSVKRDLADEILKKAAEAKPSTGKSKVVIFKRREFIAAAAVVLLIGLLVQLITQSPVKVSNKPKEVRLSENVSVAKNKVPEEVVIASSTVAGSTMASKPVTENRAAKKTQPIKLALEKNSVKPTSLSRSTEDMLAFDYGYQPNLMEGMGIATDEDGLYALKM